MSHTPQRPKKPCITPGCPNLARGGPRGPRCLTCQREWDRDRNQRPGRAAYKDPAYRALPRFGPCQLQLPGCTGWGTTRDHVIPLSRGGTNDPSNVVVACRECNSSKHNRTD